MTLLPLVLALVLAPALLSIVNRTKALFAGRVGPPLLQPYHDIVKLLRKGAVYSKTTSAVFRAGPIVGLAATLLAVSLVPLAGARAYASFEGDLLLLVGLLALVRFVTVAAALDTGSSFEGMGASREVQISTLAEPALLLGLLALARLTESFSLSTALEGVSWNTWAAEAPALILVAATFLIVTLAENARIPVDDPNTHLELTMVHEVMVLDHGGVDFAFITYAQALKLWITSAVLAALLVPIRSGYPLLDAVVCLFGLGAVAVFIGIIESTMARLRLTKVPQLLVGASVFATVGLVLAVVER
jgi:formate hydrogenlyase subunit 4